MCDVSCLVAPSPRSILPIVNDTAWSFHLAPSEGLDRMWELVILGDNIFDRHGVERRIHPLPRELFNDTGPIMLRLSGEHDGCPYQTMWGQSWTQVKAAGIRKTWLEDSLHKRELS